MRGDGEDATLDAEEGVREGVNGEGCALLRSRPRPGCGELCDGCDGGGSGGTGTFTFIGIDCEGFVLRNYIVSRWFDSL